MPQINLASEVFRARLIARRRRTFYVLSGLVLLFAAGTWGFLLFLRARTEERIDSVGREIAGVEAQLQTRRPEVEAIKLFAQRLALLNDRLGAHVGWSNILTELERTVVPSAALKKLAGSVETGNISAEVVVPSLDAAADLIASLQRIQGTNETFFETVEAAGFSENASAAGGAPGASGYTVGLKLTVPKRAFSLSPSAL